MSLSRGDLVKNLEVVLTQPGVFVKEIPAHSTGVVLDTEGGTFSTQRAHVRFNVDGEELEEWVDVDELLRVS